MTFILAKCGLNNFWKFFEHIKGVSKTSSQDYNLNKMANK